MENKIKEAVAAKNEMKEVLDETTKADEVIAKHLGKPVYTKEEVNKIKSSDPEISKSKMVMHQML